MGASFKDYMYISAELARFCATTALTYNMHSQTVLWTGILADDLDMPPEVRERHERIRTGLYRWILEDGALMSQPLSEGIARGATAGVATIATPVPGGFKINGRKVFASLAGAADAYNFTCRVEGEEGLRFLSVHSDNPGVKIVGDWDTLGMRGTDSRTLLFEDAFVAADDELLPTGLFDQLAARWPHVYLTLTPTYIGLTRAVVDFVQGYLGSNPPPGIPARRDVAPKQWAWAEIQIAYERSRSLWECAVAEAGLDPSPEQLRRAWAAAYTAMETAPEVAALAIRACGGGSLMRNLPLEQHYRDARCGSVMLPWSAEVCLELLGRFGLYEGLEDHRQV
jgi:alkylation response protein AidB-like acyl-CoA dehydrogenase